MKSIILELKSNIDYIDYLECMVEENTKNVIQETREFNIVKLHKINHLLIN